MEKVIHRADSRGFANHGWLQATHSFSFANWYNPEKVQFGALRVLNDDIIAPAMGFSTHPHQNMEIITIPLSGKLKHKDSLANEWQYVNPNEVQVMSAGTGVYHSEMNANSDAYLSLFQIWIMPNVQNVSPRYDQKTFDEKDRNNTLQVLVDAMNSDSNEALQIHQNAKISRATITENNEINYTMKSENHGVYVMNVSGSFLVDGEHIEQRDAVGVYNASNFSIKAKETSDILFIEVPMM